MTYMTAAKNTQVEIVAEAQKITHLERLMYTSQISAKINHLRVESGIQYNWSVTKARYQLEILDRSGKGVKVIPMSEFMPFFEFHAYMMSFSHVEVA